MYWVIWQNIRTNVSDCHEMKNRLYLTCQRLCMDSSFVVICAYYMKRYWRIVSCEDQCIGVHWSFFVSMVSIISRTNSYVNSFIHTFLFCFSIFFTIICFCWLSFTPIVILVYWMEEMPWLRKKLQFLNNYEII